MTIRNEYKQLKKENDIIFSTLAECDRDTITGIVNTINNTCGINYEVELVRKDLIAMAASAEADGQYLPAVIGDVDAFKRDLLASMPRPKLIDYMLDSLVWLCLFGLAISLTHLLLGGPWDCYYDAAMLGICIVVMMPSAWLLKRLVPSAWLTADKGGLYGAAQAAVLVVWLVLFSLLYRWVYPAEHRRAQCNSNRPVCGDYPGAARLAHPPVQSVGRCPTLARCG